MGIGKERDARGAGIVKKKKRLRPPDTVSVSVVHLKSPQQQLE